MCGGRERHGGWGATSPFRSRGFESPRSGSDGASPSRRYRRGWSESGSRGLRPPEGAIVTGLFQAPSREPASSHTIRQDAAGPNGRVALSWLAQERHRVPVSRSHPQTNGGVPVRSPDPVPYPRSSPASRWLLRQCFPAGGEGGFHGGVHRGVVVGLLLRGSSRDGLCGGCEFFASERGDEQG